MKIDDSSIFRVVPLSIIAFAIVFGILFKQVDDEENNRAFREGQEAAQSEISLDLNPYHYENVRYMYWKKGYANYLIKQKNND